MVIVIKNKNSFVTEIVKYPIGHWKLNDNASNAVVVDNIGGYNGLATANTSTMTTVGKINAAFNFSGSTTDVVEVADDSAFDLQTKGSVVFWFNLNSTTQLEFVRIIEKEGESPRNGWTIIFYNTSKRIGYEFWDEQSDVSDEKMSKTDWDAKVWYHIAFTWDTTLSSDNVKGYVNGSLDFANSDSDSPGLNDLPMIFGASTSAGNSGFDGKLDDIRIYDFSLSSEEVLAIYNKGNGTEDEISNKINFIMKQSNKRIALKMSNERITLKEVN